jgi:hypothetical protein
MICFCFKKKSKTNTLRYARAQVKQIGGGRRCDLFFSKKCGIERNESMEGCRVRGYSVGKDQHQLRGLINRTNILFCQGGSCRLIYNEVGL